MRNKDKLIKKFNFPPHGDARGMLVAIEGIKDIPFKIKRIYYIYNTKTNVARGFHAHKHLEQVLICVHGSCKVVLDDGYNRETVELNNPSEGLYIANDIWREMSDFSSDAVLLVLASELYDESDYIRNYDDFKKMISEKYHE